MAPKVFGRSGLTNPLLLFAYSQHATAYLDGTESVSHFSYTQPRNGKHHVYVSSHTSLSFWSRYVNCEQTVNIEISEDRETEVLSIWKNEYCIIYVIALSWNGSDLWIFRISFLILYEQSNEMDQNLPGLFNSFELIGSHN